MEQLYFRLEPENSHSLEFFVPHSGAIDAIAAGCAVVDRVAVGRDRFVELVVSGPKGSGKSHLIEGLKRRFAQDRVDVLVLNGEDGHPEDLVSQFVSTYERRKSAGGILFVEVRSLPVLRTDLEGHLMSRLRAGSSLALEYPREAELPLLIHSILERMNLKLPETAVQYLLRRLPSDPLSFHQLLALVDDVAMRSNRPVGRKLISEVVRRSSDPGSAENDDSGAEFTKEK